MRKSEKQKLQTIIELVKYMQKMNFDNNVTLNNLDFLIEKLRVNASNDFINSLFDIRKNVLLNKENK